ncbi:pyridoxine 5'-phosphate synthase [Shinella sumterensis]|mgnify:CR=1 FL=1|jgi:pyridoxine 5-phosphate synthase|uniref:pyridoxine 5'-phosphate synthase n=1 Tax=Shinella sumterensis TaxID=1967501 RepID=UPI00106E2338|nr:pyridoxine 5'-phosphate synthase [Shinella sumterensis]MCD1263659.1 pyridoxine 5'-phosphate synthase [Shinella sumterensis]MDP9589824.1 pyridoxine 5-phosphate synthase [Shinella zoogloeoides]TFE97993.1 pyridoxine 5'-phosphate synthase [Shinella sumterensis]
MPAKLSVNLNAIAMLRNRRDLPWPSVTDLGRIALDAGASGLTVHPRPDQRHVRFSDLAPIRALVDEAGAGAEFNIEGFPEENFMRLVEEHRPEQVTLVPDDPSQATSDHGWDFRKSHNLLGNIVDRLKKLGLRVSVFADGDPDREALTIAREIGADRIELYTGPYGGCYDNPAEGERILETLGETADIAFDLGLGVNAGHDLTVANLPPLVARIPGLAEVSIGHGLTADALQYGMAETVRRFCRACGQDV